MMSGETLASSIDRYLGVSGFAHQGLGLGGSPGITAAGFVVISS